MGTILGKLTLENQQNIQNCIGELIPRQESQEYRSLVERVQKERALTAILAQVPTEEQASGTSLSELKLYTRALWRQGLRILANIPRAYS